MSQDKTLLPCPWCGKEMEGPISVSEGSTFRWRKVDGCCTDGPEIRHNTLADDQEAAEIKSRADAIAAWNTRPLAAPEAVAPAGEAVSESRESRMTTLRRDSTGKPTIWCDPEIADIVSALNAGGVPTVASCSGHGERNGIVSLADGRELIIAENYATARDYEKLLTPPTQVAPAGDAVAWMEPHEGHVVTAAAKQESWARNVFTIPLYTTPPAPVAVIEARLSAIVRWLEKNQPDVFKRGLWDAINSAEAGKASERGEWA